MIEPFIELFKYYSYIFIILIWSKNLQKGNNEGFLWHQNYGLNKKMESFVLIVFVSLQDNSWKLANLINIDWCFENVLPTS